VLTKSDLHQNVSGHDQTSHRVSAVSGDGLTGLQSHIAEIVAGRIGQPADLPPLVASARQRTALELAEHELDLFRAAWREGALPAPVAATHLRAAIGALDELIGAIDVDEVFSRVFATFCVGK
jgi:tRNA modification GTPase